MNAPETISQYNERGDPETVHHTFSTASYALSLYVKKC